MRSILEPCRPAITDKSAIIGDAIRVLNQLKTESQDMQEANKKLQEDIKALKVSYDKYHYEILNGSFKIFLILSFTKDKFSSLITG